ncbi:MAG: bifunctional (p)ppGpp synthetase/guanosine-3',5'-bis(diphosphate) 3'-pyrophosphohydrolase [Acidobacteriota bacterium]|nr:bifunctional (p)ppGpp synthetase/guanosine-3',5'-bis(diphosphate) 3'-pyrophosphohydrolase [Acidobacteriota bacterium]
MPLLTAFRARHPKHPAASIVRAYEMAAQAHQGQLRNSGEAYISHPLAVATILAGLGLDDVTIISALLHDAVEDTALGLDEIESEFGADVAAIVDGVTKLDRVRFDSRQAQQAATMRKMLVAMAKDPRVLLIKLADRLHNMQTIAAMPEWKQKRSAQETLDIYAPLAHRFGIQDIRWQLEDLAFAALHPRRYAEIEQMVATRAPEREIYLAQVIDHVNERLAAARITAQVTGRPKHLYSIYEKMVVKGKEFDEIYDLVGVRVLVESVKDCWAALGAIHGAWTPVPGRFKDYINTPKFNLYQSLHTTVVGPQGKAIEAQIASSSSNSSATCVPYSESTAIPNHFTDPMPATHSLPKKIPPAILPQLPASPSLPPIPYTPSTPIQHRYQNSYASPMSSPVLDPHMHSLPPNSPYPYK